MNKFHFNFLALALLMTCSSVHAQSCPFSSEEKCTVGKDSCGSKDYVDVSDAEVALLGKQTFHANIAMIEKALKERGVKLPERGTITSDFRSALISFQESVGLPATGEVNQSTLDKLGVKF